MQNVKFFLVYNSSAEIMDEKDKQIMKILKDDARAGYGDIGSKIGLSKGAVRKRIKTLTDEGVIRKFTVKVKVFLQKEPMLSHYLPQRGGRTLEVSKKLPELLGYSFNKDREAISTLFCVITGIMVTEA